MATSPTRIANICLAVLQDTPISSINDDSDRAIACKTFLDQAVEEVLAAHPWKWATRRTLLSRDQGTPEFDYKYQYRLPADCVRVFAIKSDGTDVDDWDTEENFLLCDVEGPLQAQLGIHKKNYTYMPAWLASICGGKLAILVSSPLAKEDSDFNRARVFFKEALADGKAIEAHSKAKKTSKTQAKPSGFEKVMKRKRA